MRPLDGPGMPTFDDASPGLKAAATAFDSGDDAQVEQLLTEARVRDTLTLWHLLSRVSPAERVRVYDRIAELVAPPPNAPRDLVMRLDTEALRHWREELAWH